MDERISGATVRLATGELNTETMIGFLCVKFVETYRLTQIVLSTQHHEWTKLSNIFKLGLSTEAIPHLYFPRMGSLEIAHMT